MSKSDAWPEGADPKASYLAWSLPMDEEAAAKVFEQRFGRPPEYVAEVGIMLRVGPVPDGRDG